MNTIRNSATIHEFPVPGRLPRRNDGFETNTRLGVPRICADALDGAWYHSEAIREDEQCRDTIVPLTFPRQ